MKHAWLAIDPGIATGWVLLDDAGKILGTSVWGTAELRTSLDLLVRTCYTRGIALDAVVERMPPGKMGQLGVKLEAVRRDISLVLTDTYEIPTAYVLPGEWKPSRVARATRFPRHWQGTPLTIHQKDALRMGLYVIDKRRETR